MPQALAAAEEAARTPHSHAGDQTGWRFYRAGQQPSWADPARRDEVCADLSGRPVLTRLPDLLRLRRELAGVAAGDSHVLQAGDCAEDFAECTPEHAARKEEALARLAGVIAAPTGLPVVRIGRLAGQFAKPRSAATEDVNGRQLPAFRGHIVNSEAPDPASRRHDPDRMLRAYRAAKAVADALDGRHARNPADGTRTWISHEALVMDYETALVRFDESAGGWFLGSTHLPWIGERTRHSMGAHVRLLADVMNPVACKVSGKVQVRDLLDVVERLDPGREPGRLTLIARFGKDDVRTLLPPLAQAVKNAGHPVVWLCDPMHGNTYKASNGLKTRRLDDICDEIRGFVSALRGVGVRPGGLHLETAAEDVTECVGADVPDEAALTARYTSLCDPRLSPVQAGLAVDTFVSAL
ncbi:3-deoxy-7-phosphoheptulonate synthase [Streptomyces xanthochromogenes]|uniref:Phospho-2-dehydro-3-deoxyheptonate aldolase n=1 Tax=Streptomyces xanthochromogenes TaxID=67384 RepID=A0ABQ2ZVK6_9ACTN|nr:3-deoxy-7-phosphoheptulonate synthase [Streptomyces xanthochromogenes]GGY27269.1 phospho-2-dehydro-3-deoxyheptonate aldolase [Streptomyces xanthochromogenes]